jgi:putative SOS response-associated peptidase YedK
MCGRYAHRALGRFNIAPGTDCQVIIPVDGVPEPSLAHWGFTPHWLKDPARAQINARAETVAEKPMFRDSFRKRRCLVPADGWYEWQRDGKVRQPWFFQLENGAPFAFAGIWTPGPAPERRNSFALLTTAPTRMAARIHGRMPVVLPGKDWEEWLDEHPQGPGRLQFLCRTREDLPLEAWTVSAAVNRPQFDEAGCVEPTGPVVKRA